jgi:hypothetical protein
MLKMEKTFRKYVIGLLRKKNVVLKIPYWRCRKDKDYINLDTLGGFRNLYTFIGINTGDYSLLDVYNNMIPSTRDRTSIVNNINNYREMCLIRLMEEFVRTFDIIEPANVNKLTIGTREYFGYSSPSVFRNVANFLEGSNQCFSRIMDENPIHLVQSQEHFAIHHSAPHRLHPDNLSTPNKVLFQRQMYNNMGMLTGIQTE